MEFYMTKDEFIKLIDKIHDSYRFCNTYNMFLKRGGVEGFCKAPECGTECVQILHRVLGDRDIDNALSLFCHDMRFGNKYNQELVDRELGHGVDISTVDNLYDYLFTPITEEVVVSDNMD